MVTILNLIKSFILFLNHIFHSFFFTVEAVYETTFSPTLPTPKKFDVNGQHRKIEVLWKCQGLKEQTKEGLGSVRG
jgi:hypothetical protein